MGFEDKYISAEDLKLDLASKKVPISNDAYAIGEMLDILKEKIEVLISKLT